MMLQGPRSVGVKSIDSELSPRASLTPNHRAILSPALDLPPGRTYEYPDGPMIIDLDLYKSKGKQPTARQFRISLAKKKVTRERRGKRAKWAGPLSLARAWKGSPTPSARPEPSEPRMVRCLCHRSRHRDTRTTTARKISYNRCLLNVRGTSGGPTPFTPPFNENYPFDLHR